MMAAGIEPIGYILGLETEYEQIMVAVRYDFLNISVHPHHWHGSPMVSFLQTLS
jgi:hypothetical protein